MLNVTLKLSHFLIKSNKTYFKYMGLLVTLKSTGVKTTGADGDVRVLLLNLLYTTF